MRLKLPRTLSWFLFIAAILSLLAVAILTSLTIFNLNKSLGWVSHTQEVLRVLNRLEGDIAAAESEQLSFAIMEDNARLQSYHARIAAIDQTLSETRALVSDNQNQTQRLAALQPVILLKIAEMNQAVELTRRGERDTARKLVLEKGSSLRDQVRNGIEEMKDDEKRLLGERTANSQFQAQRTIVMLAVVTLLGLVLMLAVFYEMRTALRRRRQLDRTRERFLNVSLDMLCIAGFDGYFKRLNPAWERTLGFTPAELQAAPYLDFVHPEDRADTIAESARLATGARSIAFQNRYRCKDGSYKWLAWTAVPDAEDEIVYAVARDVSEQRAGEDELRKLALTDDLTGLFNRRGFEALAEQQLRLAKRNGTKLLMAYIDVDYLKQINDTFGHQEGSRAIVAASGVIKESFRLTDIAARLGGDEFAILLIDAGRNERELISKRLAQHVHKYNAEQKPPRPLSLSIGFASLDYETMTHLDDLILKADAAMYVHKRSKQQG